MGQLPKIDADAFAENAVELNDTTVRSALRERSEAFVEYLQDEAAHKLKTTERSRMDVIRDALETLHRDGFEIPYDTGEPSVSVFTHPEFVADVEAEAGEMIRQAADSDGVRVDRESVYAAPELSRGRALAVHHDAIVPTSLSGSWKPYLVRHPRGVVDMEVGE